MSLNKFITWLSTARGKQFSFSVSLVATSGTFLAYYLPNTLLIEQYRDLIHLYESGESVPLSEKLKARFDKALDYCDVPNEERNMYSPFHIIGFDVFSAGTTYSRFGSIIGIPVNFTYDDITKINKRGIHVNGESVVWSTDEAQDLLKSLVLSENAQLYAMCREIKMCDSPKLIIHSLSATIWVAATYAINHHLNLKFNYFAKPLGFRIFIYCLVCAFTAGNFIFSKDVSQVYIEAKIDKELKNKHPILATGGEEFYTQILKRNIALRKLMGKEGESVYSALGNENYLLRNRHLPLVQRKDFFKDNIQY